MKYRYLLIPFFIVCLMVFIIGDRDGFVNKEIVSSEYDISYPFFGNSKIDSFIYDYLRLDSISDNAIIDYDICDEGDLYFLTFYGFDRYREFSSSFVIDTFNSSIKETFLRSYDYDIDFSDNKRGKKLIALTFDDGPNYNTSKLIDVLNRYNVKATFFVLGSRVLGNEKIIKKMFDSGMEIGNHTYNHVLLTKYDENRVKSEISSTNEVIYSITGKYPSLFRPSYGSVNSIIKRNSNMPIIIWDIDTLDWKYHNSKKIINRVINKVRDGDIILMHDIYSATLNATNEIIPLLLDNGYSFVTVSELFYYNNIDLEKGKVYGMAR